MTKPPLLIMGMHGMGDCLHQRAVVRHYAQTREVWLETSWASMYHDLDVRLKRRPVALRTQAKNSAREIALFTGRDPPRHAERMRVAYSGAAVMASKSQTVLEAMCNVTQTPYATADYRLPIPENWTSSLRASWPWQTNGRPILVARPLVSRPEWKGSGLRNADPGAYARLLASIRRQFFVVSVADLAVGKEWIVGEPPEADVTLHAGELPFEHLAALFSISDLVMTSSGFGAILGPAVGTPTINVVGGYENTGAHSSGSRFVPMLNIGPRNSCHCFTSLCLRICDKSFDVAAAEEAVQQFVSSIGDNSQSKGTMTWLNDPSSPASLDKTAAI